MTEKTNNFVLDVEPTEECCDNCVYASIPEGTEPCDTCIHDPWAKDGTVITAEEYSNAERVPIIDNKPEGLY